MRLFGQDTGNLDIRRRKRVLVKSRRHSFGIIGE